MSQSDVLRTKMGSWIHNKQNVLFIGKHGIGKTSLVKQAFDDAKLNWLYFSASTMDPWCDFIGVPKETTESYKGKDISYLKLVRPKAFATGEVEALFFDELNRSHKKVRNAVMELIQFKSINGEKFPNLKVVWAAINPFEEEVYDVERLDPSHLDRFQVHYRLPYKPDLDYFSSKYGDKFAKSAIEWWNELNEEEKEKISPRRLDYALDTFNFKGDLRDVLPVTSNVSKLIGALTHGPLIAIIEELMKTKNKVEAKSFISNENNYASAIKYIIESDTMMKFFMPLLSREKIASVILENDSVINFVLKNIKEEEVFMDLCNDIIKANQNQALVKKIRKSLTENTNLNDALVNFRKEGRNTVVTYALKSNSSFYIDILKFDESLKPSRLPEDIWSDFLEFAKTIPEYINVNDAKSCLATMNAFCLLVLTSDFNKNNANTIPGIVNNCLKNISEKDRNAYEDITKNNFFVIKNVLEKCKIVGSTNKIKLDW